MGDLINLIEHAGGCVALFVLLLIYLRSLHAENRKELRSLKNRIENGQ